jgi:hypothetical protein
MAVSRASGQPVGRSGDLHSDRIEEAPSPGRMRWGMVLTWFMRLLAILWIMKGLSAWAVILGVWMPAGLFEARPTGYQAAIIYFALVDLIAAVGLWMVSTWGGVMWLLAVMSHLILAAFFPRIVSGGAAIPIAFLGLLITYLAVSWLSAREAQAASR